MRWARSGLAVAAGFTIFSVLFAVLGPGLGAVLTTLAGGVMAGYLTAKIAQSRELLHGGAAAVLVAASVVSQSALTLPARILVAVIAAAAITAGAWVRSQGRLHGLDAVDGNNSLGRHTREGEGGEERS